LETAEELAALQALGLEARHAEEKLRLEQLLREAEARAKPTRCGLLYGARRRSWVGAVTQVLTGPGLHAIDLDEELGDTKSADMLVSAGDPLRRLVEVKAACRAAPENLVGHLERHLMTWRQLRPDEPGTGGVLVVNHQHGLHPSERSARVYCRPSSWPGCP
jgi:hypothetical protein